MGWRGGGEAGGGQGITAREAAGSAGLRVVGISGGCGWWVWGWGGMRADDRMPPEEGRTDLINAVN